MHRSQGILAGCGASGELFLGASAGNVKMGRIGQARGLRKIPCVGIWLMVKAQGGGSLPSDLQCEMGQLYYIIIFHANAHNVQTANAHNVQTLTTCKRSQRANEYNIIYYYFLGWPTQGLGEGFQQGTQGCYVPSRV